MASVDEMLEHTAPGDLDWIFVSPAAVYGAHVPGERRGDYHRAAIVAWFRNPASPRRPAPVRASRAGDGRPAHRRPAH